MGFQLGRAHRAVREAWSQQIADLALTPPQAAILRAVCADPGVGVRELGRWAQTDPMNAKRLVDHLERGGLVESTVDPGHRQRRSVRPTERGRVVAAEVTRRAARWHRHLTRSVGSTELEELRQLLGKLEEAAGRPSAPASGRR